MKVAWLTDIHLDHVAPVQREALAAAIRECGADVVLLGGDIAEATSLEDTLTAVATAIARPVYFVLGNHDYYGGSISDVVKATARLSDAQPNLNWLAQCPVVQLAPGVALIGHGGWGDGRFGDYWGSRIILNDHVLIRELSGLSRAELLERLNALGDEAGAYVRRQLSEAVAHSEHVLLLTHVPPFTGACWHDGAISEADWVPHFTCAAVGDAILEIMRAHSTTQLTVLCGHTHSTGEYRPLPNVTVVTGGAVYGAPRISSVLTFE